MDYVITIKDRVYANRMPCKINKLAMDYNVNEVESLKLFCYDNQR